MEVLFIITARQIGGAELYAEHLITELSSGQYGGEASCRFTVALADHPKLQSLAGSLGKMARVCVFPFDRVLCLPGIMRELQRLAAQHELVHLNSNHPGSRLGILMGFALTRAGRPVIAVEHSATAMNTIRVPRVLAWCLPALFRWSRRGVSRVVAVSGESRRALIQDYRLSPDIVEVVYNGIDICTFANPKSDRSTLRRELGIPDDQLVTLVVARLSPAKGHRFLVEAAPAILASHPRAHFVFAGGGEETRALTRQIAQAGLAGHFSLLGARSDVADLLHASDLFVLPSLGEGFSLSIIEALASGLPVVATRVGGVEEILKDGQNGFLALPANPLSLARAVGRALDLDTPAREELRRAGREVAAEFSIEATAEQMMALYQRVRDSETRMRQHKRCLSRS